MRNFDSNAANSCEGFIYVDWVDFFAQRRWSKQHGSRTALLRRENPSSQLVNPNAECPSRVFFKDRIGEAFLSTRMACRVSFTRERVIWRLFDTPRRASFC